MSNVDLIQNLIGVLGQPAVDSLAGDISDMADRNDEPWKEAILRTLADMTSSHGIAGVQMGIDLIEGMINNSDEIPDLSELSLRAQSDLLAELQRAEADRKQAASVFLKKVGESLGKVLSGVLAGLV